MSLLRAEWLCTQKHWNPKVTTIFGVAARYRRADVGSSHNGVNPVEYSE
jgi:hypothetical protein